MKLSLNTQCAVCKRGSKHLKKDAEALKDIREAGFDTVDLDLLFTSNPAFVLRSENWEQEIETIGLTAERLGMTIGQVHLPRVDNWLEDFSSSGLSDLYDECMRRACIAVKTLRIPVAVVHPREYPGHADQMSYSKAENIRYFSQYIDMCLSGGAAFTFENMPPFKKLKTACRFGSRYENLMDLTEAFHDPRIGVCWDTGHANQSGIVQGVAVRSLGAKIKALHLHDNHKAVGDEHLIPGAGDIDWNDFLSSLVEIGYNGNLNLELVTNLEDGAERASYLRSAYSCACRLKEDFDQLALAHNR